MDGRATAGHQGAPVKSNLQLAEDSPIARELGDMVLAALERNPLFISAALPSRVYPPMFNRYEGGMHFGSHVDGAVRLLPGTGLKIRTDLSATLFLAPPEDYDGGELLVEDSYGVQRVKLPAGDMVLYPARQPAPRRAGDARRAPRVLLLGAEHGARRRAAHAALRPGHVDHAPDARCARKPGIGVAHRLLSQPAAHVGGALR